MTAVQIKTTRWYHDRIIDLILASEIPLSQNDIAKMIGYSPSWVSIMVNSDAFKERLAERKGELTDPVIAASINDRLDALARRSLDKLLERVDSGAPLRTPDLIAMAKLGVGDKNTRPAAPQQQNNLYVVALPPQAQNSTQWLQSAQGVGDRRFPPPSNGGLIPAIPFVENAKAPSPGPGALQRFLGG